MEPEKVVNKSMRWRLTAAMAMALVWVGCSRLQLTLTPSPETLLIPPVPGVAFPRQKPVQGPRTFMTALLIGTLDLENGCLVVHPLDGGPPVLPIWPPEFTLHADEERLAVINTSLPTSSRANASIAEQAVAIAGQEICMSGGHVTHVDEWVRQQIPSTCPRAYFIVGQPESVRPNLYPHSELFAYEPLTNGERSILFLRYKPAFLEQAEVSRHLQGTLVLYEQDRFLRLETGQGPGPATLLWPSDWDLCFEGDAVIVIDATKQEIARIGDSLTLKAHPIAQSWESEIYQRATKELPCDACCNFWLVEGVASTP